MHLLMVDIVGCQQRSKKGKDECFVFYLDDDYYYVNELQRPCESPGKPKFFVDMLNLVANFYFIFVGKFKAKFLEMNGLATVAEF